MSSFSRASRTGPRRVALLTAAVVAGGLVNTIYPAAAAPSPFAGQQLTWQACGLPGLECAKITVPRDWRTPGDGQTLQVAISRTKATQPAGRKGVVFTNPGGPSGSGLALPWSLSTAQPKLAAQYDVIGMDPRGVGSSTQLNCDVAVEPLVAANAYDTRDLSTAAAAARTAATKAIADGCAANPLTPYVNTWQTTHDMDLIRVLLGEQKLNYVGYSYGTWLGAKYAALFPAGAGKVVLDSNTAWMDDLASAWQLMPMAFQRRFDDQFTGWASRSLFAKYLGTSADQVKAVYEEARATYLRYTGMPSAGTNLDGLVRTSLYTDAGFFNAALNVGVLKACIVDNKDWSPLAVTLCLIDYINDVSANLPAQAVSAEQATALLQNPAGVRPGKPGVEAALAAAREATGPTVTLNGVFYAVRCGDGGQWHSPSWWAGYQKQFSASYPLAGYSIPQEVCAHWSLPAQRLPNPDQRSLSPIVMVQSEFDPATAYENVGRNTAQFRDARLVSVQDNGTHGLYGLRGNSCVDDVVNAYLLDGTAPAARTVCASLPLPFETTVHPVAGPVDDKTTPRSTRAVLVDQRVRDEIEKILG
ncbi:alpha/beta hydrolase [Lentzea sp. NPDC051213]|uniref:alpha/beta hydrolase n=1 Tax=Lentzea sp. NPDC051213 TaxID=3364126 RepID=UPI0037B6ABE1